AADLTEVARVEVELPEGLVGAVADLAEAEEVDDRGGLDLPLRPDQLASLLEGVGARGGPVAVGVVAALRRAAGPQGLLVELDALGVDGAEHRPAEVAVAHGQRLLLPAVGR